MTGTTRSSRWSMTPPGRGGPSLRIERDDSLGDAQATASAPLASLLDITVSISCETPVAPPSRRTLTLVGVAGASTWERGSGHGRDRRSIESHQERTNPITSFLAVSLGDWAQGRRAHRAREQSEASSSAVKRLGSSGPEAKTLGGLARRARRLGPRGEAPLRGAVYYTTCVHCP